MKAYYLSIKDEDDAGQEVVFANTAKEAKRQFYGTELAANLESHLDIRVNRAYEYDGMESLTPAQLAKEQWRRGWRWFDVDYPDPDTATDPEFIKWYQDTFEERGTA